MTAIAQADNAPQSKRQQYMRTSMSNNDPDTTVDVPKEEGTYAVAPTEEVLLDNGNIPVIAPNAPQQNTTDDSNQQSLDVQTKKTLIGIAIAAVVMIIVVIILANVIGTQETELQSSREDGRGSGCGCNAVKQEGRIVVTACGVDVGDTGYYFYCPDRCESNYDDEDLREIYYVQNTSNSTQGTCYCYTHDMYYNDVDYCFNARAAYEVTMWDYECCTYGRPYRVQSTELHSDIAYIDCEDYTYHDDDEWKAFIEDTKANDSVNMAMVSQWKTQAVAEYTSIATFAKFSLQLMSIGAPLWLMELSNQAALDEIKAVATLNQQKKNSIRTNLH
eukprot:153296_1